MRGLDIYLRERNGDQGTQYADLKKSNRDPIIHAHGASLNHTPFVLTSRVVSES